MIKGVIFDMDGVLVDSVKYAKGMGIEYAEMFPLVPGVWKALNALKREYKLGLATSTSRKNAETVLKKYEVLDFFKGRCYGDEVVNGKPDPEIYLRCSEKLNLEANECVVVEDSEAGFYGVKAAKMKLIGRRAGHNKNNNFDLCDAVIDGLNELEEVVKSLKF